MVGFPRGWETEILSCHLDERRGDTLGHIHLLDLVEQLGVLRGGFRAREVVLDLHTMCAAGQASGAPVWEAAWCAARRPGSSGSPMGEGNRAGARLCDVLALLEPAAPPVGPLSADVMNTMARASDRLAS